MPAITPRPIINSWAQNTANKDAPSQTAIGDGIEYASPLTSSEPNGAMYIIFEAVKNLQRLGGMYSPLIPYIKGQSCHVLCLMGTSYGIRRFICLSATDISATPPITGATVTTLNGTDVYSGGTVDTTNWTDADEMEGYAPTTLSCAYDGTIASVPAFAACTVGKRQYVSVSASAQTDINPETNRDYFVKAPTLDEILSIMDGIYYPKWAGSAVGSAPIRRLGVYRFRGQTVEAFGMFLDGVGFTDNGTSSPSKFWRSLSSVYTSLCVVNNSVMRDLLFSGSEGGTVTPKNLLGRVPAHVGTAILSSGTSEARAALAEVQDDRFQAWQLGATGDASGARNYWGITSTRDSTSGFTSATGFTRLLLAVDGQGDATMVKAMNDGTNGPPRQGLTTREATFSVPLPMAVSLLPYGSITL